VLPGSVCDGVAKMPAGAATLVSVEHPTGEFSVTLETDPADKTKVTKSALLRTARLLMRGEAMVPRKIWAGQGAEA
jgi:4-oxalomesaconate tautomerase